MTDVDTTGSDFSDFTGCTVGIIGLGLIGGSYAKGLCRLGVKHIIGIDTDGRTLSQALAERVIDEGIQQGSSELKKATLLIFCLPVQSMIEFIRNNVAYFNERVILTDVAGIKGHTADAINAILGPHMDFVPGHPMAGREGKGFGQSDAAIFDKANYIVVPQPGNEPAHIQLVRRMALALGCSHVVEVSPEEHDRLIAYTSSLPHVLATALMNSQSLDDHTKYFIAGSFRDGTRVADINAPLWTQLFFSNKDNLIQEINRFRDSLAEFTELISRGDTEQMTAYLQKAAERRKELMNGSHTC